MFIYFVVKIVRKIKGRKPQGGYSFWERSRHWSFSSKKIRNIMTKNNLKIIEEEATSFLFLVTGYTNYFALIEISLALTS